MKFSVKSKIADVMKGLSDMKKEQNKATYRALNTSIRKVNTQTRRALAQEMKLKNQQKIKELISIRTAGPNQLRASVIVKDDTIGAEYSKIVTVKQNTKGRRKNFNITFNGKKLKNGFRPDNLGELSGVGIFVPGLPGTRSEKTGKRKMKRVFLYTSVQEMIHGKIDEIQEEIGLDAFDAEYDRLIAAAIQRLRF